MKILASAMLAPGTALFAGLSGFVLTALFFALIPSRRAARGQGAPPAADPAHFWQMLLRKGGAKDGWSVAVLDGAGACLFLCGRAAEYLEACRAQIGPA